MASFDVGEVIKVPFPYTDRPVRERRPALVVANGGALKEPGLLWVLMVTSAAHRRWPGDVAVSDLSGAGLPVPSVVRTAKIATIEAQEALPLGRLSAADDLLVRHELDQTWKRGS
ncbi:MAG: type II toxin-antitoxin system PemK/MazF family toxin [Spirochaetales bacterium]